MKRIFLNNIKNIRKIFLVLFCAITMHKCAAPDYYSIEDIEKERVKMEKGKNKSAENLLEIYQDVKQPYEVRLMALKALANTELEFVKESIRAAIAEGTLIELDMMNQSINMLLDYGDEESAESLIACLRTTESQIMDVRENVVNAISTIGSNNQIITLVELYEISKTNHNRMNEILALSLGSIGDEQVIPVLMEITNNEDLNMNVRAQAIDILAKKNSTDLVDYFVKILDDSEMNNNLSKYTNMIFQEFENPRMMMALVESYQVGKSEYHRLLNTLIDAMGNYNSKEIKESLLDISKDGDNPHHIRIKAINSLKDLADKEIVDEMLIMLEDPDNYKYYNEIIALIKSVGDSKEVNDNLRKVAFQAMKNHSGE